MASILNSPKDSSQRILFKLIELEWKNLECVRVFHFKKIICLLCLMCVLYGMPERQNHTEVSHRADEFLNTDKGFQACKKKKRNKIKLKVFHSVCLLSTCS